MHLRPKCAQWIKIVESGVNRIVEKIEDCDINETDGLRDPIIFGNSVVSKLKG